MSFGYELAYLLIANLSSSKNMLHSHRKTLKCCPKYYLFIQSTIHNMLSFFCLHFSAILSYIPPIIYCFIILTFQNFIFHLFVATIFFGAFKFDCPLILLKLYHVLLFFFSIQQHFNSQIFFTLLKFV
jgi:hypothetical protein